MKNTLSYIIIIALVCMAVQANAQNNDKPDIRFNQLTITKQDNKAVIKMNIKLDSLNMKTYDMLTLTPVIKSADSTIVKSFSPIVITGNNRSKTLNRAIGLNNYQFETAPQQIVKHRKNQKQTIPLVVELPYEKWLHNSTLFVYEDLKGCACDDEGEYQTLLMTPIFPAVYNPVYNLCYITPPVEAVKARSEKYAAHLNFKVAKYDLLYDFGDNARILNEVDSIITAIRSDKNLTVNEFKITGYASPEGNFNSNMTLSENRAYAFVNYLRDKYGIDPNMLKTDWVGEDWNGLREMVDKSFITDRDNVLFLIDNEYDIAKRKADLKKLSKGSTYKELLNNYYPFLRRNEYTISFVVRSFNVDEAKEIIKTKPQYLSLNEMFMVADTYPKNSDEFKAVFDIISRYYPDNNIVKANRATVELEHGNWGNAIRELESIDENIPEVWNNLGYAYIQKQDYKKAEEYFKKAAGAKLNCGLTNLSEYEKWLEVQP